LGEKRGRPTGGRRYEKTGLVATVVVMRGGKIRAMKTSPGNVKSKRER